MLDLSWEARNDNASPVRAVAGVSCWPRCRTRPPWSGSCGTLRQAQGRLSACGVIQRTSSRSAGHRRICGRPSPISPRHTMTCRRSIRRRSGQQTASPEAERGARVDRSVQSTEKAKKSALDRGYARVQSARSGRDRGCGESVRLVRRQVSRGGPALAVLCTKLRQAASQCGRKGRYS